MTSLEPLRESGYDVDRFPANKRAALEKLTATEIIALAEIHTKLERDPVFTERNDGNILW